MKQNYRGHSKPAKKQGHYLDVPLQGSLDEQKKVIDVIILMCLNAGSRQGTALLVAGEFAKALGW